MKKSRFGYFVLFPVQIHLCIYCHRTKMLVTWEFSAFTAVIHSLVFRAFGIWALGFNIASVALLQNVKPASITVESAFTDKASSKASRSFQAICSITSQVWASFSSSGANFTPTSLPRWLYICAVSQFISSTSSRFACLTRIFSLKAKSSGSECYFAWSRINNLSPLSCTSSYIWKIETYETINKQIPLTTSW